MEGTDEILQQNADDGDYLCPECLAAGKTLRLRSPQGLGSHRRRMHGVKGDGGRQRAKHQTIYLNEGDERLVEFIQDALVISSLSEAIRTSIRAYAMSLERLLNK